MELPGTVVPKRLSENDRELWTRFSRDVRPLRPIGAAELPKARPAELEQPREAATRAPGWSAPIVFAIDTRGAGLDDASWRGLATGRLAPTRRLDLHGHTVEAAFRALGRFLEQASLDRVRCVEIVTGHGRLTGGGAIRRELPHWLDRPELRALVVAGRHPERSSGGAVRLLLRRRRHR